MTPSRVFDERSDRCALENAKHFSSLGFANRDDETGVRIGDHPFWESSHRAFVNPWDREECYRFGLAEECWVRSESIKLKIGVAG